MGKFKQEYIGSANAIVSHAIVMPPINMEDGQVPPLYYFTNNTAWDTGAQFYLVHIGLSNGELITEHEVYCSDIDDYDLLLGMDIITQTDFLITNKDGKTTFQFRTPSEGGVEL